MANSQFAQPFQGFPRLDTPFIEQPSGFVAAPWQRFLLALWIKTGSANSSLPGTYYLNSTSTGAIGVYNALTGQFVGELQPINPQPPQVLTLGSSPFVWTPSTSGTLFVYGAELEIKRSASAYAPIGLVGGAVPMLQGDSARITWTSTNAPTATWLPSS